MSLDPGAPMSAPIRLEPAISWGSIWAGSVTSLALSITLTLLGAGFGLKLAYPGLPTHDALAAFTPMLGAGVIVIQVLSAGLGGYVTGRMRHIWPGVHSDESHFRDTAHGMITWAVATVVGLLISALAIDPYLQQMAATAAALSADAGLGPVDMVRSANIAAQASFFLAIGLLLSAFIAAVAARIGGMRSEEMHGRI